MKTLNINEKNLIAGGDSCYLGSTPNYVFESTNSECAKLDIISREPSKLKDLLLILQLNPSEASKKDPNGRTIVDQSLTTFLANHLSK